MVSCYIKWVKTSWTNSITFFIRWYPFYDFLWLLSPPTKACIRPQLLRKDRISGLLISGNRPDIELLVASDIWGRISGWSYQIYEAAYPVGLISGLIRYLRKVFRYSAGYSACYTGQPDWTFGIRPGITSGYSSTLTFGPSLSNPCLIKILKQTVCSLSSL